MATTGATPRKFAEKIAMHNQKGAEEEAEFRKIMAECASVKGTTSGPGHGGPTGPAQNSSMPQSTPRVSFALILMEFCEGCVDKVSDREENASCQGVLG